MSLFYGDDKKEKEKEQELYPSIIGNNSPSKNNDPFDRKKNSNIDPRASVFLKKDQQKEKDPTCCEKYCACFSIEYYQQYFKVTNQDVKKRVLLNLKFWQGGFFTPADQEYDLYGPFWLYTSLIFVVSAIHNVLMYQTYKYFTYDFQIIGKAFSIFYLLGFGFSAAMGFILKCSGVESTVSQIICVYGYSISIYIICCLLCIINNSLIQWIFLIYACATKIAFLMKNIIGGLEIPTSKKVLFTVLIVVEAVLQFLIIKFMFMNPAGEDPPRASHNMEHSILHLRFNHDF